ncbi:hypothetical protein AeMF1_012667 [Aphanomyces euteiches]|nr:hypothetical protein AeMF1_012667 [Aphanomyces euteiches]KAH9192418.1 hypothetical protein AeNC1_005599 [Aphanomyces euteiches]
MVQTTRNYRAIWDFSDVAATEQRFSALLTPDTPLVDALCIQTQIARTYGLRDRFDEALSLLDKIDEQTATLPNPTDVDAIEVKVRSRMERGRALRSSKRAQEAKPHFLEATTLAEKAHMDELAIDAMHMVALVMEDPKESLSWSEKALQLALASEDPEARKWDASLANNIGWTYHDAGDFTQAMHYFKTALAARERLGAPKQIHIAKWMIARTHRSLKEYAQALEILHALENGSTEEAGYVSEELAENYEALNEHDKAKPYFLQAYTQLKDDKSLEPARLERLLTLSQA